MKIEKPEIIFKDHEDRTSNIGELSTLLETRRCVLKLVDAHNAAEDKDRESLESKDQQIEELCAENNRMRNIMADDSERQRLLKRIKELEAEIAALKLATKSEPKPEAKPKAKTLKDGEKEFQNCLDKLCELFYKR